MKNLFDLAIIGGGIVGLATAYKIQQRNPKKSIIVFEKEKELASHQTGRNSGVIHSGLYYQPNSYRAKTCVDGRKQLVDFAKKHKIAHDVCGKIVAATTYDEEKKLPSLVKRGKENGLKGLEIIDKHQTKDIEPFVEAIASIWVPETGIIDFKGITLKLAELLISVNPKSKIITSCEVFNFYKENSIKIITKKGVFNCNNIIACGGLFSDRIAKKDKLNLNLKIVGFRGDYYDLSASGKEKVKNLIYPVPNPEFPFLGVHFTRMTDGTIECGPNAVFTFKREGYGKLDFNLNDTLDALSYRGTWNLLFKHFKFGINEYSRAFSKKLFLKTLQRLIPTLKMDDIKTGRSGVRACALGKNGNLIEDFVFKENEYAIHVLNAPSPAATACLAIGDEIANKAKKNFGYN